MRGPDRARPRGAPSSPRALDLAGDHVSLYQLTIEPDTIFERLRDAGKLAMPDEDLSLALFAADAGIDRGARSSGL